MLLAESEGEARRACGRRAERALQRADERRGLDDAVIGEAVGEEHDGARAPLTATVRQLAEHVDALEQPAAQVRRATRG